MLRITMLGFAHPLGTSQQLGMWPRCSCPTPLAPPLLQGIIGLCIPGYGYQRPHGLPTPMRRHIHGQNRGAQQGQKQPQTVPFCC